MVSINFQERFKNKASIISQNGGLEIKPERAITKASNIQLHDGAIRSSATYIIKPGFLLPSMKSNIKSSENSFYGSPSVANSEPVLQYKGVNDPKEKSIFKGHQSATPIGIKNSNYNLNNLQQSLNYKPYTLKDYQSIKPKEYVHFGGLGPSNIGSTDWLKKKELNDKRWKYGKDIYYYNAAKLPLIPLNHPVKPVYAEENSRQRALNFAKKIHKPTLKSRVDIS